MNENYIVDDEETVAVELGCFTDLNNLDLWRVDHNFDGWWPGWGLRWWNNDLASFRKEIHQSEALVKV